MGNHTQSRKWALVINNPKDAELDHDAIREILQRFSLTYYCLADEIASTGTYHTHIFLYSPSPIRFSTIKARFPVAHIEKRMAARGKTEITSARKAAGPIQIKRKPRSLEHSRKAVTFQTKRKKMLRKCSG